MMPASPDNVVLQLARLILEMKSDGIALTERSILEAVEHPGWDSMPRVHDWRAYVPPAVRRNWSLLALSARLCVFETAALIAQDQRVGDVMLTRAVRRHG